MPLLIADNKFTRNSAFYSTIGIYIRAFTSPGMSIFNINPSAESDLQCGGYYLFRNTFT